MIPPAASRSTSTAPQPLERARTTRWDYSVTAAIFLLSRVIAHHLGLRFNLDLSWMFLSDPLWLQEDYLHSIYYFHAFPPGMNILTGMALQIAPQHLTQLFHGLFTLSGLILCLTICELCRLLGVGRFGSSVCALLFSLSPPSFYFENLNLYTLPSTTLLTVSVLLFYRSLKREKNSSWFGFFLSCCALGFLRSVFHLVWFGAMLLGALLASRQRKQILLGAAIPAAILLSLYMKNFALFEVFGSTSWSGANLTNATAKIISKKARTDLIQEGKLSPYSSLSVFSSPKKYLLLTPGLADAPRPRSLHSLDLWRPTFRSGNFNHQLFLTVNQKRRQDAYYLIGEEPGKYFSAVAHTASFDLLSPSTTWHPKNSSPTSPHYQHRKVLGSYEAVYNRLLHSWPTAPQGIYLGLPLLLLFGIVRAFKALSASTHTKRLGGSPLALIIFNIAFVLMLSSLFGSLECSRYRYLVEPFIWILAALFFSHAFSRLRCIVISYCEERPLKQS